MITSRHFIWLVVGATGVVIGCGGSPPPPEPETAVPVIVAPTAADDTKPTTQATQPAKPTDPPVTLPNDSGGKAVARALVVPPPLPLDRPTDTKPTPYSSPHDHGEIPFPPVSLRPFGPSPAPTAGAVKPSPPAERHLPDTSIATMPEGRQRDLPPLKATTSSNPRAADVSMQAWKQHDRPPLDDPTADLSGMRVIDTPLPLTRGQLPFLRVSIPDPFELVEHLKGKLGKDTELGVGPSK